MKFFYPVLLATLMFGSQGIAGPLLALPFPGTAKFNLRLTQQSVLSQLISSKTNHTATRTNLTQVFRWTRTNDVMDSADFLRLVENSYNTNFPAGAKLNNWFTHFCVVDKTGTNILLDLAPVLSGTISDTQVVSEVWKLITTYKPGRTNLFDNDHEIQRTTASLTYDDSALTTADGTHSVFHLDGSYVAVGIVTGPTAKGNFTMSFKLTGNGTLRNKFTIFQGGIVTPLKVDDFF